jgi:hypothetical protein
LIAAAALLTAILLWATGDDGPAARDPQADAKARAVALEALAARAEAGDSAALATLAEVPEPERTLRIRRALLQGTCDEPDRERCWAQVEAAARAEPALAEDPRTLHELRKFAESDAHGAAALELSAGLGSRGADLLFDVSSDRSLGKSAQRARELLKEERVSRAASPALQAALRLAGALRAPRCAELKRLLGELSAAFDQRALPSLNRLNERRGCGLLGLGDCYGCLRTGRELKSAIEGAKARPSPKIELVPRPVPSAP